MFAINYNPVLSFLDLVQQQQQQQLRQQFRPKISKKIETEDEYQIHIFKPYGDFNSYEVRALRSQNGLVKLVIESEPDNFQATVSFSLSEIDLHEINWLYFRAENTLVLRIPKKQKVCYPQFYFPGCVIAGEEQRDLGQEQLRREAEENARREAEKARRDAEENARREAEKARREAEKARREAEEKARARREAEERARREEQARKAAEEKARKEAAQKEAEENARKEAKAKEQAKLQERKERVRREAEARKARAQQEQFVEQLLQNFFPPLLSQVSQIQAGSQKSPEKVNSESQSNPSPSPSPQKEHRQPSPQPSPKPDANDDNESVQSEPLTPEVGSPKLEAKDESLDLHKHPSLEEVEDEEFVMFRKKFEQ
ncbi:hypothetical protein JA9_004537 [Meyerozyma sp. JA9]|nr:hypothetical protein JA9_004537 [Meyerozyma sp. JA9]